MRVKKQRKAQMKIQEMAFVLVAIIIFFILVALVYFAIRLSSMKEDVSLLKDKSAKELARKLADIPEFSWAECSGCIDADKVLALKGRNSYKKFWDISCLKVEKVYPNYTNVECTIVNYPDCTTITIIDITKDCGIFMSAFVSLCSYESDSGGYTKCELGKIYISSKAT